MFLIENFFILQLTQGPLETTAEDFWQMIWEQNSRIVIMLNNIIEKGSPK